MKTCLSLTRLLGLVCLACLALGSRAATLVVTNLADNGPGSLRQTIMNAASGDVITFGVTGTITVGAGGIMFITNNLSIVGPGPSGLAVSGNNATRPFTIAPGSTVHMSGLTIRNGAYFFGGGLQNSGTLVMSNCVVADNRTYDGSTSGSDGTGGRGAGIINFGTLTMISCAVSNNRTGNGRNGANGGNGVPLSPQGLSGGDGKSGGIGGGIYNQESLTLIACTINNNAAGDGGSGGNGGNGVLGVDIPPFGNGGPGGVGGTGGSGGGVYNSSSAAMLTLSNCTLYGNSAGGGGSGGNGGNPAPGGSAVGGYGGAGGEPGHGGAVYNVNFAQLSLTTSTVNANKAGDGGADGIDGPGVFLGPGPASGGNGGGIYTLSVTSTVLRSTLIASNHPGRAPFNPMMNGTGADLHGTNFFSHGHNLVGSNDVYFTLLNQNSTDIIPAPFSQTNALLAALADNGGPTLTVRLLPGSPAIDTGDNQLTNAFWTDQRGAPRLSGAHVDIGAFETHLPIVLNTNDNGPGSLRSTLTFSSPSETISFGPSLSGQSIHLTSGQLAISKSLTIDASALASGVVIDAGGNSRVLEITSGNVVTLDSLTLMNGRAISGGGVLVNNGATLTLNRTTLAENSAAFGGGLANYGTVTFSGSIVVNNSATNNSGGIENDGGIMRIEDSIISSNSASSYGGGIANWFSGALTITNSTVSANRAWTGGGMYVHDGNLRMEKSAIDNNSADIGGGIAANHGLLTIEDSVFSGNRAVLSAGGLSGSSDTNDLRGCTFTNNHANYGGGVVNHTGSLRIDGCTLSANSATNNSGAIENNGGTVEVIDSMLVGNSAFTGGGLANYFSGSVTVSGSTFWLNSALAGGGLLALDGNVSLANSTLVENSATQHGGGISSAGNLVLANVTVSGNGAGTKGGGINNAGGTLLMTNVIVAGNTAATGPNISGSFSGANNLTAGNPLLTVLADHGGPTLTMLPLPGSPAIDAGNIGITNTLATDQRGYVRQYGPGVDIGAAEARFIVVTDLADSGSNSLRDAVARGPELVTFANNLSGQTITLTSGQIVLADDLTIDASTLAGGIRISGNHNSRIFQVNAGATVTLDSLKVINGNAGSGGGVLVNNGATLTLNRTTLAENSAAFGGGLANYGTVTFSGSTVVNNFATNNSGGIENDGGIMKIENSIISSNSASSSGGGIANWFSGALSITNSTISANRANNGGGILNNSSVLTLQNSSIFSNAAAFGGGALNVSDSVLTLHSSTLFNNSATNNGGGIVNNASVLGLNNSTLSGNVAGFGGGVYNLNNGTVRLNNSTLSGNSAASAASAGGLRNVSGICLLTNTIVAGNTVGNNLPGNVSGVIGGANNLVTGNPLLAPLDYYGGPTPTMPPLHGSPAIDAGTDAVTNFLPTDQRGYPRRSGAAVDIGADEAQVVSPGNPPLLSNPLVQSDGAMLVTFESTPNVDFTVLASTNLIQWEVLGPATPNLSGQYEFLDAEARNYNRRFYKVASP